MKPGPFPHQGWKTVAVYAGPSPNKTGYRGKTLRELTSLGASGDDAESLVRRADRFLLAPKYEGRNRMSVGAKRKASAA